MKYISTRGGGKPLLFHEAILQGLALDGGLFYPSSIPQLDLAALRGQSFVEVATHLFALYAEGSFSLEECRALCTETYRAPFFPEDVAPVAKLSEDLFVLELFHGPTAAFKDYALQFLPKVLSRSLAKEEASDYCILVGTSGDTGGAALYGFADVAQTTCLSFFPRDGVSPLQKVQMLTAPGDNTLAREVEMDFDHIQLTLKSLFADADFLREVRDRFGVSLSSANSINIGRLLPQVFYAVYAYLQMVERGDIALGEVVDAVVPTGNFGDIFATFLAKQMGVPFGKLICANNANNASAELIRTGSLQRPALVPTLAPAMDIVIASNMERLFFWASEQDGSVVSSLEQDLLQTGSLTLPPEMLKNIQEHFEGDFVSDEAIHQGMQHLFETYQYLPDPHTTIGLLAAERRAGSNKALVYSTAHYGKFGFTVADAFSHSYTSHAEALEQLAHTVNRPALPPVLQALDVDHPPTHPLLQGEGDLLAKEIFAFLETQYQR